MSEKGMLIFFCGKMGAGKSTKSKLMASEKNAVLLSEDDWLSALYPHQISSFDDYLKYSNQLKPLVKSHVQNILSTGTNVVMDFPANTHGQRRTEQPERAAFDTEAVFTQVTKFFEAPNQSEGLKITQLVENA